MEIVSNESKGFRHRDRHDHGAERASDRTRPCFIRADRRHELGTAERAAGEIIRAHRWSKPPRITAPGEKPVGVIGAQQHWREQQRPGITDAGSDPQPFAVWREYQSRERAHPDQQDRGDRPAAPFHQRSDGNGAAAGGQHQAMRRTHHQSHPFPQYGECGRGPKHRERPAAEIGGEQRERRQHHRRQDAQSEVA